MGARIVKPGRDEAPSARESKRGVRRFGRLQLALGIALGALGTSGFAEALKGGGWWLWLLGAAGVFVGFLFVRTGIDSFFYQPEIAATTAPRRRVTIPDELPAPKLGQLLVEECKLVSKEDMELALARHQESGRPLGQVLVEMELVSEAELERALGVQKGLRDPWREGVEKD